MKFVGLVTSTQCVEIVGREKDTVQPPSISDVRSCFADPDDISPSVCRDFNNPWGNEVLAYISDNDGSILSRENRRNKR